MSAEISATGSELTEAASLNEFAASGFDVIPAHDELFISHSAWMRRTHLTVGFRSRELLGLDEAIRQAEQISLELTFFDEAIEKLFQNGYPLGEADKIREAKEKSAYWIVRRAFDAWVKSEGEWQESRRNHDFAPTKVYLRLLDLQEKYKDLVPDTAEIITAGNELTAQLFANSRVQLRGADSSNIMQSVSQASSVGSIGTQIGKAHKAIEDIVMPHFGTSLQNVAAKDPAVARELMKHFPNMTANIHHIMSLVPGINVAASTVSALSKLYDVRKTDMQRTQLIRVARAVPEGDARTALNVIRDWQTQYIMDQKMAACADAGMAGMQLLSALVPGAAPVASLAGAARALAQSLAIVAELGAQYRESRKLEDYLRNCETIGSEIFSVCPLVAAYYVLNVPFSLFSLHLVPFESPTFFAETELLRDSGEMKAVMVGAEKVLDASKFILTKEGKPFRSQESMSIENELRIAGGQLKRKLFS
ncbi:hypothetical protein SH139x_005198 [Planctomycetaceae bacterium SH139]